jgi:hypothetical protein
VPLDTKCHEVHFCEVSDVNLITRGIREGRDQVRERRTMHWYNPKTRSAEDVPAPFTDEEALEVLRGDHNSAAFVKEYERLRNEGMGVAQALIFVGHTFRLWHLRYQPIG